MTASLLAVTTSCTRRVARSNESLTSASRRTASDRTSSLGVDWSPAPYLSRQGSYSIDGLDQWLSGLGQEQTGPASPFVYGRIGIIDIYGSDNVLVRLEEMGGLANVDKRHRRPLSPRFHTPHQTSALVNVLPNTRDGYMNNVR
jgi:hypothetical protein